MKDKKEEKLIGQKESSNNDTQDLIAGTRKEVGEVGLVVNRFRLRCRSDELLASPMGSSGANLDY